MDDIRLGLAFRSARMRRRLRQQDLATMAGVSDSLVSRLEHGEIARLSVGTVRTIAARVGIRAGTLRS
jgi:transcriptional regulator with XRE-family HTH domain